VGGGEVDRRPDMTRVQTELFGKRRDAVFGVALCMPQRGHHFPDVGADRECGTAPGRSIAIHNSRMVQGVEPLGHQSLQKCALGDSFRASLALEPRLYDGIEPV
jgi:hypothetical protein